MRDAVVAAPARGAGGTLRRYLPLLRLHYHCSFIVVLLGVATVTRRLTVELAASLAALYVSFNVFLYGGIYTINAIADARSDRLHPLKRKRPVASGAVAPAAATWLAVALLAAGFATAAVLFEPVIAGFYAAFLAANLAYTFIAKRIRFVDLLLNAATYPLRYAMGARIAGSAVPAYLPGIVFIVAIGACAVRRSVEKSTGYSRGMLSAVEAAAFVAIGVLRAVDSTNPDVFYYCGAATYLVLVFGVEFVPPLRGVFLRFWTR